MKRSRRWIGKQSNDDDDIFRHSRAGGNHAKKPFREANNVLLLSRYAGILFNQLDSRLRGNDGVLA